MLPKTCSRKKKLVQKKNIYILSYEINKLKISTIEIKKCGDSIMTSELDAVFLAETVTT